MNNLSKAIMITGAIISIIAGCCLDSESIYGLYAGIACVLGCFTIGVGYAMYVLAERRSNWSFYDFHQPDRLDGDVEWIEEGIIGIETKK